MGDAALGQVLYRPGAPNSVLGDPGGDTSGVQVFALGDCPLDEVGSLVLRVGDDSLGVGRADHAVVTAGSGQPDSGGQLVGEQGEL